MDEDAFGDYIYADYDTGNGLLDREQPQLVAERPEPPRSRLPPPPPRPSFDRRPGPNSGGGPSNFRRGSSSLLQGRDACQSGAKSVAHEDQCDLYYECYEGQGFLTSCPNGLVYGGEGRFGLIGNCDYPHNVNCQAREGRSKLHFLPHCMFNVLSCIYFMRSNTHWVTMHDCILYKCMTLCDLQKTEPRT